jgi:hypothetical protein
VDKPIELKLLRNHCGVYILAMDPEVFHSLDKPGLGDEVLTAVMTQEKALIACPEVNFDLETLGYRIVNVVRIVFQRWLRAIYVSTMRNPQHP